jgi:hypothetical protein
MPKRREPGKPVALGHPWSIVFFQRRREDDPTESVPGAAFLEACPSGVRANLVAILKAVAEAPPPRFAGGLQWQAMHGDMAGFYEARAMGPGKRLYRVFCILEREAEGLPGPSLVIITGLDKPNETAFSKADYRRVRELGEEYRARSPRSIER